MVSVSKTVLISTIPTWLALDDASGGNRDPDRGKVGDVHTKGLAPCERRDGVCARRGRNNRRSYRFRVTGHRQLTRDSDVWSESLN